MLCGFSDSQSKAPLGVCLAEFDEGGKGEENLGQDFILFGLKRTKRSLTYQLADQSTIAVMH